MGVMFSVHGDSVRPILPPRAFSVGFEEEIVPEVMFFTFTDPKIVVKSLFPILYLKEKNNKPHIFTTPLPSGRGVVKIWGLLFFGVFSKFLSESVQPPVRMIYDKSQKSEKTDLSKPFSSSFPPYQMIHNVEIERVRVPLIYYCPSSSILPIKCHYHQFFIPGVVTNS